MMNRIPYNAYAEKVLMPAIDQDVLADWGEPDLFARELREAFRPLRSAD
jgi:hypothetical protein